MGNRVKRIAILGSTGSIGQQTLDVIRALNSRFRVVGLAGGTNIKLLEKQLAEFRPEMFCASVEPAANHGADFLSMEEIAAHPEVDLLVVATSGKVGLPPTLAALKAGKTVALASKEVLVMAGEIVTREARQNGARILPVDSEHSAIWQCLQGEGNNRVQRIFLTASGGPFYHYPRTKLARVTVEETLRHPVWKMGRKVTIDSATLMNKGLEAIEAHWFFDVPFDSIEILAHPQCTVHSMVEFADNSVKAQLAFPDMKLPIQYAICYPERLPNLQLPRLDLGKVHSLTFEPVDSGKFPCLRLALHAGKLGGTYPAVLCAADEVAVNLFLSHRIGFLDIASLVEQTLERHQAIDKPDLDDILQADGWAREFAEHLSSRWGNVHPETDKGGWRMNSGLVK